MQNDPKCEYCACEANYRCATDGKFLCSQQCLQKLYQYENTKRCPYYTASCNLNVLHSQNSSGSSSNNKYINESAERIINNYQKVKIQNRDQVLKKLNRKRQSLLAKSLKNGKELSWEEFSGSLKDYSFKNQVATQNQNQYSVVLLRQKDFDKGQLRIHANCVLKLAENIQFNPNKNDDWKPLFEQQSDFDRIYGGEAFALDFFAAFSLENGADVLLDLNGYKLEQHLDHATQQRFFSLIEIADQPFMPTEGPANFGSSIDHVSNIFIENGKLGLSSHHCIHSNSASNIMVQNVEFSDYEVAAISLNEPQNLIVRNCQFKGNRRDVSINAHYSAARFIQKFGNYVLKTEINDKNKENVLKVALQRLSVPMEKTFQIIQQKRDPKQISSVFRHDSGILDGSAYAILIHSRGVAVNQFQELENKGQHSARNVFLENLQIENTISDVRETITLFDKKREKPIIDTAGALFNIQEVLNKDGTYKPTLLSSAQIAVADYILSSEDLRRDPRLQVLTINQDIIDWTRSNKSLNDYLLKNGRYAIKRDSDLMFHVNKGSVAVRLCNTENAVLKNVSIKNTVAIGDYGSFRALPSEPSTVENSDLILYKDSKDGGHPLQGKMIGYCGSDSRAISVSACDRVVFDNVHIDGVESKHGSAIGIDLMNQSTNIEFKTKHSSIENIIGLKEPQSFLEIRSLKQPESIGLNVGKQCECKGVERYLEIHDNIHCGNFSTSKIQIN